MRRILLILGAVLGVIVAVGIFLFIQTTRPSEVEVPVAIVDIPAGTVLEPYFFRVTRMANVDPQTLARWVTLATWNLADGKVTTSDIRAGFPVARAQVDPNSSRALETRLSNVLTGTYDYYVVFPVKPDDIGNYIQPGDRIDMIINIGGSKSSALVLPIPTVTPTTQMTQTALAPVSKLVMQNMLVLRIDRNISQSSAAAQANQQPAPSINDVKRIYVKVDRDQLEVLSFVLNNGTNNIAVRAANGSEETLPTDGVTWDDFVRWFYAQRGNQADGATPFDSISPYAPLVK